MSGIDMKERVIAQEKIMNKADKQETTQKYLKNDYQVKHSRQTKRRRTSIRKGQFK